MLTEHIDKNISDDSEFVFSNSKIMYIKFIAMFLQYSFID